MSIGVSQMEKELEAKVKYTHKRLSEFDKADDRHLEEEVKKFFMKY